MADIVKTNEALGIVKTLFFQEEKELNDSWFVFFFSKYSEIPRCLNTRSLFKEVF